MKVIVANSRMRGFSLVELMVAVTVSSLLLVGVVALFASSRASYETTERLSRIQENGRFALDQLATDIRSSGYQSCARGTTPSRMSDYSISTVVGNPAVTDPPDIRWNFAVPVQGYDSVGANTWAPVLVGGELNPPANSAGDILVLRIPRREVRALEVRTNQATGADPLQVYDVPSMRLAAGDIASVADCEARAFFQVTGYNPGTGEIAHAVGSQTPGNWRDTLVHPFKKGAIVVPVVTTIYYLAPTPRNDGDNETRNMSLYRKTAGAALSDEIAQDIDRMEIQYGVDDGIGTGNIAGDGRVDRYVTANDVGGRWERVLTVQIALLARAPEEYGNDRDSVTYTLLTNPAGVAVTAGPFNDRTQRKVFTATLAVRNQIFD
jgi:type IV pilus assembly protein PilW